MAVTARSVSRPVALLALLSLLVGAHAGWMSGGGSAVITIDGQASLDAALKEHDFLAVEYYAPVRRRARSGAATQPEHLLSRRLSGRLPASRRAPAPAFRAGLRRVPI